VKLTGVCLIIALAFAAGSVRAQANAEEIAFWESVRASNSAPELQAYIDRYPNGAFVALARNRLAALGVKPAAAPVPVRPAAPAAALAPQAAPASSGSPHVGDTWTYRLSYPRLRGQWGQSSKPSATHVIKVGAATEGQIVDQLSIDGGAPTDTTHTKGAYLATQGMSIFSPYLEVLNGSVVGARLGSVDIQDQPCNTTYRCEASARAYGPETVTVPAGQFQATKLVVSESWRPAGSGSGSQFGAPQFNGGRTLTIWYAPQIKRAVKFQSRKTVGDIPPVEPDFDLELVTYQLK